MPHIEMFIYSVFKMLYSDIPLERGTINTIYYYYY